MGNVARNFDKDGKATIPSAYRIKGIRMENHKGGSVDLQEMVVSVEVRESLYSNTLILSLILKDEYNMIEALPIIGQEKIKIELIKKTKDPVVTEEIVSLKFFVTEYPGFMRPDEEHVQLYTINGVSEHAFCSPFKNISRATSGITINEIEKIYKKDLGVSDFVVLGDAISRFKGIINIQHPCQAANWLLSKSFDSQKAPFYLFQVFNGNIVLASLSSLYEADPYYKYSNIKGFKTTPGTKEDYIERQGRILTIASDLRMAKGILASSGAFASKHNYLEISNKSYKNHKFDYSQMAISNTLEGKPTLSEEFNIGGEPYSKLFDAHNQYIATNDIAHGPTIKNYNSLKEEMMGITRAHVENLETMTHDVKLYGDMGLNPGVIIELEFPKAIDPGLDSKSNLIDKHLSGKYLITSAVHKFDGGDYYTHVKVKRDSFSATI